MLTGLTGYFELIATAVAAATALAFAWRRWLKPFIVVVRESAELVKAQLNPNGGLSLVDTVRRIDASQKQNERHFKSLEARLAEVAKRVAKVEEATAAAKEVSDGAG